MNEVPPCLVDHRSYLADPLFVQNKVTLQFKGEMAKEDSPYCIIFCKVLKRDVERFEEALSQLTNKMLVLNRVGIEVQAGNFSSWWTNKECADSNAKAENEKSDSGEKFYLDVGNPEWRKLAEEMPEGVEK